MDRSDNPGFPLRPALLVLLALNAVLRFWIVFRPLEYTDGLTIPDDTYLSLEIARNIAHGAGPAYAGEPTNGFQPLSVFLMVPFFMAAPDSHLGAVHAAAALSAAFDTLALLMFCRIVARRCRSRAALYPAALAWILNPAGIRTAANGMETSMACFFLLWALLILDREFMREGAVPSRRAGIALGGVIGLGMLARIDVILFGAAAAGAILWAGRRDLPGSTRHVTAAAAAASLAYLPWVAYSFYHTGDLYPVSGRAVRFMSLSTVDFSPTFRNWYSLMLKAGIDTVETAEWTVMIAGAACLLALLALRRPSLSGLREKVAWTGPASAHALLLFAAYTLFVFGPWFFERYLFPLTIVCALLFAALTDSLLEALKRRWQVIVAAAALGALVGTLDVTDPAFAGPFVRADSTRLGYMNIGRWAQKTFPPGTVLGSAQSGALGYFADSLSVVNLDGVVSKSCYESLRGFRMMEYLRERNVQYVIGWYSNFQYLEHQSGGLGRDDLGGMKKVGGFTSWGYDWYVAKVNYGTNEGRRP
jgi:hypothetical protein